MDFEWDETKRQSNIAKHGLDFFDVSILLAGPYLTRAARTVGAEERWSATGVVNDLYVTMIFTRRDDAIRIISLRRARDEERRAYRQVFSR